jgi:hypothetical protein
MDKNKINTNVVHVPPDQRLRSKPISLDLDVDSVRGYIADVTADLGKSREHRTHNNSSRAMLRLLASAERKLTGNYGVETSEETKQA